METILRTIIWIGFFSAMVIAYYFYLKFRSTERMKLAEKDENLAQLMMKRKVPWNIIGYSALGIGVGLVVGFYLGYVTQDDDLMGILMFSLSILFGALGIIIGQAIEKKSR